MSRSEQKVVQYLNEAHASEVALVRVLQSQIAMTPEGRFRSGLETHLEETRSHASRVQERIGQLKEGSNPLLAVVGLAESIVGQAMALAKTPGDLVRGTGGEEKILKNAKDAAATEALEIATYTALEQLAKTVGDQDTARLAASIKADEEKMLARILREIPALTKAVVSADVDGEPVYDVTETGAAQTVKAAGRSARGTGRKAARAVKDTGKKAARTTKDTGEDTVAAVAETGTKAARTTKDTGTKAAKTAAGTGTKAARKAAGTGAKAAKTAADAGAKAGESAAETGTKAAGSARTGARQARKVPGVARAEGAAKGAVATKDDLPIARYDALNVEEIVARLPKLSQIDLAKVDAYERRTDDRSTVTDRVKTLQGSEPWPGYDELTLAEVRTALDGADEQRVKDVLAYERGHKARAGVLKAAESAGVKA